jgi:hypothetical protein
MNDIITTSWTITGTALFNGTPASDVKLAAFYTDGDTYSDCMQYAEAFDPIIVSNVVNLGTTGGNFSVSIDASSILPVQADTIILIMWIDANDNNLNETTEEWKFATPSYGCPVFQNSFTCHYYLEEDDNFLMDTEYGWNQSIGLALYVPIDSAVKAGALIENYTTW